MPPKVSVIIPAYNCDRYIQQTVDSVFQQTYPHYELIVVDDGSSDQTRHVLDAYGDRLTYLYQDNRGVAAARNRGLQIAQGDLIAFLDHDDVLLPDKLAVQVTCFEQRPRTGIVHSGWRRIDHRNRSLGVVEPWHNVPVLNLRSWLQWMPVLFSAMMFRREWIERVGGLDPTFKQVCDVDLVQRLVLLGCQTEWVRQVTVCYREHDRNDSLNTIVQAQEVWDVQNRFFAQPDLPADVQNIEASCRYHTLVWLAWRLYYTGEMPEMVRYLQRSLSYTSLSPTETLLDWLEHFQRYARDYRFPFDYQTFSNTLAWRQFVSHWLD